MQGFSWILSIIFFERMKLYFFILIYDTYTIYDDKYFQLLCIYSSGNPAELLKYGRNEKKTSCMKKKLEIFDGIMYNSIDYY